MWHSMARAGHSWVTTGVTELSPAGGYNTAMPKPRFTRALAVTAIAGLAALSVSACGDSKKPSAGSNSNAPSKIGFAVASKDAYKHSVCMRSHGVTKFPDPDTTDSNGQVQISVRITPSIVNSPAFQSAQKKCAYLTPGVRSVNNSPSPAQQRAQTDGILAFSSCMRKHGFARFPDPSSQGQLSVSEIQSAGINLKAPAVKPAALACSAVSDGQITKADVEQAITNPTASGQSAQPGG
jgi:hypothetical protein